MSRDKKWLDNRPILENSYSVWMPVLDTEEPMEVDENPEEVLMQYRRRTSTPHQQNDTYSLWERYKPFLDKEEPMEVDHCCSGLVGKEIGEKSVLKRKPPFLDKEEPMEIGKGFGTLPKKLEERIKKYERSFEETEKKFCLFMEGNSNNVKTETAEKSNESLQGYTDERLELHWSCLEEQDKLTAENSNADFDYYDYFVPDDNDLYCFDIDEAPPSERKGEKATLSSVDS